MGAEQLPVYGKLVHGIIAADAEGARPVPRGLLQESGYGLVVGPVLLFCQGGGLLQGFGGQGGRWNGGK